MRRHRCTWSGRDTRITDTVATTAVTRPCAIIRTRTPTVTVTADITDCRCRSSAGTMVDTTGTEQALTTRELRYSLGALGMTPVSIRSPKRMGWWMRYTASE